MTRKAEIQGRFVRFLTKGQKQFSRWKSVWFKNYRSKAEAMKAANTWQEKGRIA